MSDVFGYGPTTPDPASNRQGAPSFVVTIRIRIRSRNYAAACARADAIWTKIRPFIEGRASVEHVDVRTEPVSRKEE